MASVLTIRRFKTRRVACGFSRELTKVRIGLDRGQRSGGFAENRELNDTKRRGAGPVEHRQAHEAAPSRRNFREDGVSHDALYADRLAMHLTKTMTIGSIAAGHLIDHLDNKEQQQR